MQTRKRIRRRAAAGFTLIEILVVVLIVGLLVGLVGPNIFRSLFKGQRGAAEIQIKNFGGMLDQYKVENYRYPDALEELTEPDENGEPITKSIPLDPWGNEYFYTVEPDGSYLIVSYGADGEEGGEDENRDIRSDEL
jgi:general secretion pathway protein G